MVGLLLDPFGESQLDFLPEDIVEPGGQQDNQSRQDKSHPQECLDRKVPPPSNIAQQTAFFTGFTHGFLEGIARFLFPV